MAQIKLIWQSKLVLLLVLPFAAASVVLQGHFFAENLAQTAIRQASGKLPCRVASDRLTATWQFSVLPNCPQY